VIVWIVD